MAAPAPSQEKPSAASSLLERLHPVRSILAHKFLAASILIVMVGLGLPVAWLKGKAYYAAEAVIFVSPRFLKNLQDDKEVEMQSNSQYREYVQQNVRTINRYDIVEEALRASPVFLRNWKLPNEPERRTVERLMASLAIRPVPDTYQVTVWLEADFKEGLAELVNKVVEVYLRKAKAEEFYASDDRILSLKAEVTQLAASVEARQQERTRLAQELGVTTFTENYVNPYDQLLVGAKQALAEARRKQIEANAALQILEGAASTARQKMLESFALELAGRDIAFTSVIATLNTRRGELLSRISGLAEKHPGRQAALIELNELEAEKQRTLASLGTKYSAVLTDQRRSEVSRTVRIVDDFGKEADRQQSQGSWFTSNYQAGIALGLQIDRDRKRMDSIDDRLRFLAQETRAPGFVRVFSDARPPDLPVRGGRRKIFLLFCIAGVLLATIVPIGLDMLDPRVFSPGDAGRTLGFPVMGWLPRKEEPYLAFWNEQVLRIAHRIDQDRCANASRVWCFTGAQAGSGTTTLVAALGRALTDLGVPALTVEANAWRSDPRYRTGSRGPGLSVVLRGNADLDDVVAMGDDEMSDHIAVGDTGDSGHLPDVHRLMEVLRGAGQAYGVVLVDLPPILASVDAEYLARSADVAVLVMESMRLQQGELGRAVRMLEKIRPKAVAAILNRVPVKGGRAFATGAFDEFAHGVSFKRSFWKSPWLWR